MNNICQACLSNTPRDVYHCREKMFGWVANFLILSTFTVVACKWPLCQIKNILRVGEMPRLSACLNPGLRQFLMAAAFFFFRRRSRNKVLTL
ncbi:MAG: hypothetical protein ABSD57_01595 [Verrucomicrobiota bacterium]|jgi:hypothetical protein